SILVVLMIVFFVISRMREKAEGDLGRSMSWMEFVRGLRSRTGADEQEEVEGEQQTISVSDPLSFFERILLVVWRLAIAALVWYMFGLWPAAVFAVVMLLLYLRWQHRYPATVIEKRKGLKRVYLLEKEFLVNYVLDRMLFSVDSRVIATQYLAVFGSISAMVFWKVILPQPMIWLRITLSLVYAGFLIAAIILAALSDWGLTKVDEGTAKIIVRWGGFRLIAWNFKGRRHMTSQGASRLNAIMRILLLKEPEEIMTFRDELVSSLGRQGSLADSWIPLDSNGMLEPDSSEATTTGKHLAMRLMHEGKGRIHPVVIDELIGATSHTSNFVAFFAQHDVLTDEELREETVVIPGMRTGTAVNDPGVRLGPDMLRWCLEDCPPAQKSRKGLFGGFRFMGFPWVDQVMMLRRESVWVVDFEKVTKTRRDKPDKADFVSLKTFLLTIHVMMAETADGPAINFDLEVYMHFRNLYKVFFAVDDWEDAMVQAIMGFVRDMVVSLPFIPAYHHKWAIANTIKECAGGNNVTVRYVPQPDPENPDPNHHEVEIIPSPDRGNPMDDALRTWGVVVTDVAAKNINPGDERGRVLLSMVFDTEQEARKISITAEAESHAIDLRGEAYEKHGAVGRRMVEQDLVAKVPRDSIVIVGGSDDDAAKAARNATLTGRAVRRQTDKDRPAE
ncbi:MAG: hypothetical protein Q8Q20_04795, partial [bacterium]|nr:hypothetical protein [bacterium]